MKLMVKTNDHSLPFVVGFRRRRRRRDACNEPISNSLLDIVNSGNFVKSGFEVVLVELNEEFFGR
jgi:hypothetical protein